MMRLGMAVFEETRRVSKNGVPCRYPFLKMITIKTLHVPHKYFYGKFSIKQARNLLVSIHLVIISYNLCKFMYNIFVYRRFARRRKVNNIHKFVNWIFNSTNDRFWTTMNPLWNIQFVHALNYYIKKLQYFYFKIELRFLSIIAILKI